MIRSLRFLPLNINFLEFCEYYGEIRKSTLVNQWLIWHLFLCLFLDRIRTKTLFQSRWCFPSCKTVMLYLECCRILIFDTLDFYPIHPFNTPLLSSCHWLQLMPLPVDSIWTALLIMYKCICQIVFVMYQLSILYLSIYLPTYLIRLCNIFIEL